MSGPNAERHNTNKPRLSMLLDAPTALTATAEVLAYGAEKYSRNNWRRGLPVTEIIDSLLRHVIAYQDGEDRDPESGLPHVAHALCNALFLAEIALTMPDCDDRACTEHRRDDAETREAIRILNAVTAITEHERGDDV